MPTKLHHPLKRELLIAGKPYVLTIDEERLKLATKASGRAASLKRRTLATASNTRGNRPFRRRARTGAARTGVPSAPSSRDAEKRSTSPATRIRPFWARITPGAGRMLVGGASYRLVSVLLTATARVGTWT